LLVFVTACASIVVKNPRKLLSIPISVFAGVALIALAVSKELSRTGTIVVAGSVPYGQMLYWLMLWTTVVLFCSSAADALILLKGLAIGSVMTAASVFLGLVVGAGNFYSGDAVSASAGWFETAKMITGVLTTGGVVLLYLGQKRQGWLYPVLACFNFVACVLTYARAGTVAMLAALIWLFVWLCVWGYGSRRSGIRFASLCLVVVILAAAAVSPTQLLSRWNDVEDGGEAGSGRATFWKIAVDNFAQEDVLDQIAGRGYFSMSTMLYEKYGDDIKHTHNDALDMLLVSGVAGGVWLLTLLFDFTSRVLRCPVASQSRAAATAVLLIYLCHGQLTGQIWGTDSMTYYTIALSSFFVLRNAPLCGERTEIEASSIGFMDLRHPYHTA
jgi:hypothetical protein